MGYIYEILLILITLNEHIIITQALDSWEAYKWQDVIHT